MLAELNVLLTDTLDSVLIIEIPFADSMLLRFGLIGVWRNQSTKCSVAITWQL